MTDEIRAAYTVGLGGLVVNFLMLAVNFFMARRANNIKAVARHEANFVRLEKPAKLLLDVDIEVENKR